MFSKIEQFYTNVSCYYCQNIRANEGNEEETLTTVDWLRGIKNVSSYFQVKNYCNYSKKSHMTNLQG